MMFGNRWLALGFVMMTLLSVYAIVGSDEEGGVLTRAQNAIEEQRAAIEGFEDAELSQPAREQAEETSFLSDEELIDPAEGDDTSGFDPSPPDARENTPADVVQIVPPGDEG
jgi:hypothetical protein